MVIKDQLTDMDVEQWSEQISQVFLESDPDNAPKMIKFLQDMQKSDNHSVMQKAYKSSTMFHMLKFFEGYFHYLTEGKGLVEVKEVIENSHMYWSMLKFTKKIYSFLIDKKSEAYVKHDSILIFYRKYKQFSYVSGIIPIAYNNTIIHIPFVQDVIDNEKIKIMSIFSALDYSPIELYIKDKKFIESDCLFIFKRVLYNALVFYNGKFSNNPFCRSYIDHISNFKHIKDLAEIMKATKWDDNSYYVELFSSEFERLGFLESFGSSDFGQGNLLEDAESKNFEDYIDYNLITEQHEMSENDITMSSEYEKMLQQEWQSIRKRVVEDNKNLSICPKSKAKSKAKKGKYINKKCSAQNSVHMQNQINEAFNKRVKEIKSEIKAGRQKFRDIKRFINQTIKLREKPISMNREGSHIVLSCEGKSPLTIVKLHNGKTISCSQAHKMFDDLIDFIL